MILGAWDGVNEGVLGLILKVCIGLRIDERSQIFARGIREYNVLAVISNHISAAHRLRYWLNESCINTGIQ
jgi:hypothetical protein